MMVPFRAIGEGLSGLVGLMLPFGAGPRGSRSALGWALHVLVILGVLGALSYLNWLLGLEKVLSSPFPALHRVWLPLLFLLVYLVFALAHWLWRLLGPERLSSAFPEIDAAWDEIRAALAQAHLDIRELPLFFVLGRPVGNEETLFAAAHMPWAVRETPPRPDAPLRVHASPEGIFLTCAASSALGRLAGSLASLAGPADPPVEQLRDRLQHICRLIARERRPYCPVNGILAVAPLPVLQRDEETLRFTTLLQTDLTIARETFQLECPAVLLVSDLEQAPGYAEFVDGYDAARRTLGQSFPLMPDIDDSEIPALFDRGVAWLCQNELLTDLFSRWRIDRTGDVDGPASGLRKNIGLYQFWSFLSAARKRLARLALHSAQTAFGTAPMVGGIFLAATGADAPRQAFVPGVFRRLLQGQNAVAWAPEALVEEHSLRRVTRLGYLALLMMLPALGGVGYWFWRQ